MIRSSFGCVAPEEAGWKGPLGGKMFKRRSKAHGNEVVKYFGVNVGDEDED
jgi:hypothetical protein